MRIVVTGGTGFVGQALASRLAGEGHDVVLPLRHMAENVDTSDRLTRIPVPSLEAMTIADWHAVLAGADAVVHTAAIAHIGSSVPEGAYAAVNRDASARLAEAAVIAGVGHFVFLSSIRAQVGATSVEIQNEQSPPAPTEAYGRSKLEAEGLVRQFFPQATVFRPTLIVGPKPKGNLRMLLRLAALPLPLPFGALDAPQAMVSLDGVLDAIALSLRAPVFAGETYCLAQQPHLSLTEILTALRQGLGRSRLLVPVPARLLTLPLRLAGKRDLAERLGGGLEVDASKMIATGWSPQEPLTSVLKRIGSSHRMA